MHPDLSVLVDELKLIKNNDNINLTHGEIRSFIRAFICAVEDSTIHPFYDLSVEQKNKIVFHLNLIRAYGIPHCDRMRMAAKCLQFIESVEGQKNNGYPEDWDKIPR